MEPFKNTGLIQPEIRPLDYLAGGESPIVYEARCYDWEQYRSADERQSVPGRWDSMSCCTFSGCNIVEMQVNYLLRKGLVPPQTKEFLHAFGYLDAQGNLDLLDWFSVNTNGTTYEKGNSLQGFWDSARKVGFLPGVLGRQVKDVSGPDEWFDKSVLTPRMFEIAKQFLDHFDIKYEWCVFPKADGTPDIQALSYHSLHAPLHIGTPTCSTWNTPEPGVVTTCGDYKRLNHATAYLGLSEGNDVHLDLDHYVPFVKRLSFDYYIPYAIKAIVSVKKPVEPVVRPTYKWTRTLDLGAVGPDVEALQKVLMIEVPQVYKIGAATGKYGNWTRAGVKALQEKARISILAPLGLNRGTGVVGKMTLSWLNKHYGA